MNQVAGGGYDVGGVLRPRPFVTGRLGHIGLYADARADVVAFYRDALGYHVSDELTMPGATEAVGTFLTYGSDHHALVIIDGQVGRARGPELDQGVTLNQMSFQVGTLQEVIDANAMFTERGMPVRRVGRDVPGSNWAVYFFDPDGHVVELFYGMEQIGWDRRSKPPENRRFLALDAPRLPVPSELDEVTQLESEGADLAGGTRWDDPGPATYDVGGVLLRRPFKVVSAGPVALWVRDVEASVRFYRDVLGLEVTERVDVGGSAVVHLRVGTEHHSLTLADIALRAEGARSTLAAYGVQVGSYAQLRAAREHLAGQGLEVVSPPGWLHTGIDLAFVVHDPAGHPVLFFHEQEQVGSLGVPLPASSRRPAMDHWPEQLAPHHPASAAATFYGPLG